MKIDNFILESDGLILKELTSKDVTQQYVEWLNDSEINKYLESRFQYQNQLTVKEFVTACKESKVNFLFGIFIKNGMKHIGNIKLGPINTHHEYAEIGLMIGDKDFWGRGIASQVISMVTQFGFYELKLKKLGSGCYESNIGSKKAFEKSGYQIEGLMRNCVKLNNTRESVLRLGCLKTDFHPLVS